MSDDDIRVYNTTYTEAGKLSTSVGYYRTFPQDRDFNEKAYSSNKLSMPILYLSAAGSMGAMGELPTQSVSKFASNFRAEVIPDCGHWISEERPVFLADRLKHWFLEE